MKTTFVSLTCGLLLTAFVTTAMASSVQTDYDHSFNLAGLRTYAFQPQARKAGDPLATSPINDRRIHDALDSQLKAQGFNDDSDAADFLISYFVTTRQGLDVQDNRTGIWFRSGGLNVSQFTEGTLVVIFQDRATGKEVWRGYLAGEITPKNLEKDVNKGVAKLVKKFVANQAGKK